MRVKWVVMLVAVSLVLSTAGALAAPGKNVGNQPAHVVDKWEQRDGESGQYQEMEKSKVRVRGKAFETDLPPVIKDGRVLIPVRAISNGLGADVEWDAENKVITIVRGETTIVLYLDSLVFTVNGVEQELDVPASLISNRTFVPLRFIAAALGERVDWDGESVDIGGDEDEEEEEEEEDDEEIVEEDEEEEEEEGSEGEE